MGHIITVEAQGRVGKPGGKEGDFAVLPVDLKDDKQAMNAFHSFTGLYGGTRQEMAEGLKRGYAKDAIFHDHLVWVQGHDQILANNMWWTRIFAHGTVGPISVVKLSEPNRKYRDDNYVLAVNHTGNCDWSLARALGITYCYYATAHLTVRKSDGKIIEHVDIWHNIPIMPPAFQRWLLGMYIVLFMSVLLNIIDEPPGAKDL